METISYRKLILGDDVRNLRIKAAKSLLALYDLTRPESVPFRFWIITTAAANFLEGGDIPSAWRVARAMDFAAMRVYRSGVRQYEGRSRKFKRLLAMDFRGYKLRGRIAGALRRIQVVYDNRKLVLDHYGKKIIPKFGGHLPNCVPQLKSPAMEPDKTKIKEGDL